jgi:hypothetical protein
MRLLLSPPENHQAYGPVYIVDTCAVIALQEVEIVGKNVLRFFRENLRLESTSIIADELKRRRDDKIIHTSEGAFWQLHSRSVAIGSTAVANWAGLKPLCSGSAPSSGSEGEASAAWHIIGRVTKSLEPCIFVTDDQSSRNLFFDNLCKHFPLVKIISSLELMRSLLLAASADRRLLLPAALATIKDAVAAKARNTTRNSFATLDGKRMADKFISEFETERRLFSTAYITINPK